MKTHDKYKFLRNLNSYQDICLVDWRLDNFCGKYESTEQKLGHKIEKFMINYLYDRLHENFSLLAKKAISFNIPYGEGVSNRHYEIDLIACIDMVPEIFFEIKASKNSRIYTIGWQKIRKLAQIARTRWPNIKSCYLFIDTGIIIKKNNPDKRHLLTIHNDLTEFNPITDLVKPDNKFIFKYD